MSCSFQNTVIILDAMALRRAGLESFLTPWAQEEQVELVCVSPEAAHQQLMEDARCKMLILNVGGASPSTPEIVSEILVLNTMRPTAALVVFSDDESLESVTATFNRGAQGYFSNSMPPDLVLKALSFILRGGSYFPPTAILRGHVNGATMVGCTDLSAVQDGNAPQHPTPLHQQPAVLESGRYSQQCSGPRATAPNAISDVGCVPNAQFIVAQHMCSDQEAGKPQLTDRQKAVLACLCRGESNKMIGRTLNMTETTVKVHVREIMRKLGVANRTQAAIAINRTDPRVSSATELVAPDLTGNSIIALR